MGLSFKNLVATYISFAFVGGAGVLINSLLLISYNEEILGRFSLAFSFLVLASQFCVGGAQFSLLNHSARFKSRQSELAAMISSSALVCVLFSSLLMAMVFLLNKISWINLYFSRVGINSGPFLVSIFFFSLNKLILVFLNALDLMISYAVFNAIRYLFLLLAIVGLTWLGALVNLVQYVFLISEFFLLIILLFFIRFKVTVLVAPKKRWLKRHLSFGAKGFVGGVLMEINSKVDILILGALMGLHYVGVYTFASSVAEGFSQVYVVIKNNIDPIFSNLLKLRKNSQISAEIAEVRRKYIPILFLLGLLVLIIYRFFFTHFFGLGEEIVSESFPSLLILMSSIFIASYFKPFVGLLIQQGKPHLYSIVIFLSVAINSVMNIVLVPQLGIEGAALSTGVAFFIESYLLFKLGCLVGKL